MAVSADDEETLPHASAEIGSGVWLNVLQDTDGWSKVANVLDAVVEAGRALADGAAADLATVKARLAQLPAISVEILLADDACIRDLNCDFRGQDKPTNVLSFPAPPTPLPPDLVEVARGQGATRSIGEIAIAFETVMREAAGLGIPPRHHLQHLVVHGILHLLGYDHETDADAVRMEALEIAILARIGVANPYMMPDRDAPDDSTHDRTTSR